MDSKLKILITDNGLKFAKERFEEFFRFKDIFRHKPIRYTPQQNGVEVTMNRTLLETRKSKMHATKCRITKIFLG